MRLHTLNIAPFRLILVLLTLLIITFTSTSSTTALAATQKTAFIRVIHASPDIGVVDIFVDGKELLRNFDFATVTDYLPLPDGTHTVKIAALGKGINAAVLTQDLVVKTGIAYTVAALGTNSTGFSFSTFEDDNTASKTGARVRVYHLAPATGTANITVANTSTNFNELNYPKASTYTTLPAGRYTFTLKTSATSIELPLTIELKDWTVNSIFAVGAQEGKPPLQFTTTQIPGIPGMPDTGSNPQLPTSQPSISNLSYLIWLPGLVVISILLLALLRLTTHVAYAKQHITKSQGIIHPHSRKQRV